MEPVPYLEEDDEEEEDWTENVRLEVIDFVLKRYGTLRAQDIAKVLNWKLRDVNQALQNLEHCGKVKRMKQGKSFTWAPIEDRCHSPMYY
jgi:Mn-dependent DtxR family transcriptional regulator